MAGNGTIKILYPVSGGVDVTTPDDIDGELIFRCRIDIPNFTNSRYEIILGETISS